MTAAIPARGSDPRERTRARILAGASAAIARHGLAKLDMADVSESAGVSRGTLYRYFRGREDLLAELSVHESLRFWEHCIEGLREAPSTEDRLRGLLLRATRQVAEHPALQRLLETDPALVLGAVQRQFPTIRDQLREVFTPSLESTAVVAGGVVELDQLVDWLTRLLITVFLIPGERAETDRGLEALFRLLTVDEAGLRGGAGS
ncbi:MAG: TetR/AcrR family transcriptional regulator [Myxococcales bacterium]|nr:TetR/AcrR family transcriptional regulator [Myxococcales bacterium]